MAFLDRKTIQPPRSLKSFLWTVVLLVILMYCVAVPRWTKQKGNYMFFYCYVSLGKHHETR